jgi:hypothetical protein
VRRSVVMVKQPGLFSPNFAATFLNAFMQLHYRMKTSTCSIYTQLEQFCIGSFTVKRI